MNDHASDGHQAAEFCTIHGQALANKIRRSDDAELRTAWELYQAYSKAASALVVEDDASVIKLVEVVNEYRARVMSILESRDNSGQEVLRSSILEEFFCYLFKNMVGKLGLPKGSTVLGKANSYVSLSFAPRSIRDLFTSPSPYIHTKDQDFMVGCAAGLRVHAKGQEEAKSADIVIPTLAIECKTYIERNMLDSCAATAARLKSAMPYCLYIVAAEYIKMDEAYPELTDIDEVYVLCKATNADRLQERKKGSPPHSIHPELVVDLYHMVERHFNQVWWSPEEALARGKVIGRP